MLIVGIDVCYLPIADIRKRLQAAGGACWCDEAQDLAGSRMRISCCCKANSSGRSVRRWCPCSAK